MLQFVAFFTAEHFSYLINKMYSNVWWGYIGDRGLGSNAPLNRSCFWQLSLMVIMIRKSSNLIFVTLHELCMMCVNLTSYMVHSILFRVSFHDDNWNGCLLSYTIEYSLLFSCVMAHTGSVRVTSAQCVRQSVASSC